MNEQKQAVHKDEQTSSNTFFFSSRSFAVRVAWSGRPRLPKVITFVKAGGGGLVYFASPLPDRPAAPKGQNTTKRGR